MAFGLFDLFFDVQDKCRDQLGNPLLELDEKIDWASFCPLLESLNTTNKKAKQVPKKR